jgi:hypothetical protein
LQWEQGDLIGPFCQWGYFWKPIVIFGKYKVAHRNEYIVGFTLFKNVFFCKNGAYKIWFAIGILIFQRCFGVAVLDSQV